VPLLSPIDDAECGHRLVEVHDLDRCAAASRHGVQNACGRLLQNERDGLAVGTQHRRLDVPVRFRQQRRDLRGATRCSDSQQLAVVDTDVVRWVEVNPGFRSALHQRAGRPRLAVGDAIASVPKRRGPVLGCDLIAVELEQRRVVAGRKIHPKVGRVAVGVDTDLLDLGRRLDLLGRAACRVDRQQVLRLIRVFGHKVQLAVFGIEGANGLLGVRTKAAVIGTRKVLEPVGGVLLIVGDTNDAGVKPAVRQLLLGGQEREVLVVRASLLVATAGDRRAGDCRRVVAGDEDAGRGRLCRWVDELQLATIAMQAGLDHNARRRRGRCRGRRRRSGPAHTGRWSAGRRRGRLVGLTATSSNQHNR